MTQIRSLSVHPRLYISPEHIRRLEHGDGSPHIEAASKRVAQLADQYVGSTTFDYPRRRHNAHLIRARIMQMRVVTLIVRWLQTGETRYRDAAVKHVEQMGRWRYWSWIAWRSGDDRPEAIFDLSYGENSATLAIAWDLLHDTLTADERRSLIDIARRRALRPFLEHTTRGRGAWWFANPHSNWNTVTTGGAGMLALSMYEQLAEARRALPRVERSVVPFFKLLDKTGGGWPEGIGYWNYGMRYGFMYLLSHERATGRRHPLLARRAVKQTLAFPLDFCPSGQPCSFGDTNKFWPLPFHYAAAERVGRTDLFGALDALPAATSDENHGWWPNDAELLLLYPRRTPRGHTTNKHVTQLYRGLDWGILADRMPAPNLYVAVRGGCVPLPHGHLDLMSFHLVAGGERLIANIVPDEYLDTTFSPRRWELAEMTSATKNTVLINGVGIANPASVTTQVIRRGRLEGLRIDATGAMGESRDEPMAKFCGRAFVNLDNRAVLIVDRAVLPHVGRFESRLHTFAELKPKRDGATIRGCSHRLSVAFAANVPASVHTAVTAPTTPGRSANLLRWCSDDLCKTFVYATLLAPDTSAAASVETHDNAIHVKATVGRHTRHVRFTRTLRLAK